MQPTNKRPKKKQKAGQQTHQQPQPPQLRHNPGHPGHNPLQTQPEPPSFKLKQNNMETLLIPRNIVEGLDLDTAQFVNDIKKTSDLIDLSLKKSNRAKSIRESEATTTKKAKQESSTPSVFSQSASNLHQMKQLVPQGNRDFGAKIFKNLTGKHYSTHDYAGATEGRNRQIQQPDQDLGQNGLFAGSKQPQMAGNEGRRHTHEMDPSPEKIGVRGLEGVPGHLMSQFNQLGDTGRGSSSRKSDRELNQPLAPIYVNYSSINTQDIEVEINEDNYIPGANNSAADDQLPAEQWKIVQEMLQKVKSAESGVLADPFAKTLPMMRNPGDAVLPISPHQPPTTKGSQDPYKTLEYAKNSSNPEIDENSDDEDEEYMASMSYNFESIEANRLDPQKVRISEPPSVNSQFKFDAKKYFNNHIRKKYQIQEKGRVSESRSLRNQVALMATSTPNLNMSLLANPHSHKESLISLKTKTESGLSGKVGGLSKGRKMSHQPRIKTVFDKAKIQSARETREAMGLPRGHQTLNQEDWPRRGPLKRAKKKNKSMSQSRPSKNERSESKPKNSRERTEKGVWGNKRRKRKPGSQKNKKKVSAVESKKEGQLTETQRKMRTFSKGMFSKQAFGRSIKTRTQNSLSKSKGRGKRSRKVGGGVVGAGGGTERTKSKAGRVRSKKRENLDGKKTERGGRFLGGNYAQRVSSGRVNEGRSSSKGRNSAEKVNIKKTLYEHQILMNNTILEPDSPSFMPESPPAELYDLQIFFNRFDFPKRPKIKKPLFNFQTDKSRQNQTTEGANEHQNSAKKHQGSQNHPETLSDTKNQKTHKTRQKAPSASSVLLPRLQKHTTAVSEASELETQRRKVRKYLKSDSLLQQAETYSPGFVEHNRMNSSPSTIKPFFQRQEYSSSRADISEIRKMRKSRNRLQTGSSLIRSHSGISQSLNRSLMDNSNVFKRSEVTEIDSGGCLKISKIRDNLSKKKSKSSRSRSNKQAPAAFKPNPGASGTKMPKSRVFNFSTISKGGYFINHYIGNLPSKKRKKSAKKRKRRPGEKSGQKNRQKFDPQKNEKNTVFERSEVTENSIHPDDSSIRVHLGFGGAPENSHSLGANFSSSLQLFGRGGLGSGEKIGGTTKAGDQPSSPQFMTEFGDLESKNGGIEPETKNQFFEIWSAQKGFGAGKVDKEVKEGASGSGGVDFVPHFEVGTNSIKKLSVAGSGGFEGDGGSNDVNEDGGEAGDLSRTVSDRFGDEEDQLDDAEQLLSDILFGSPREQFRREFDRKIEEKSSPEFREVPNRQKNTSNHQKPTQNTDPLKNPKNTKNALDALKVTSNPPNKPKNDNKQPNPSTKGPMNILDPQNKYSTAYKKLIAKNKKERLERELGTNEKGLIKGDTPSVSEDISSRIMHQNPASPGSMMMNQPYDASSSGFKVKRSPYNAGPILGSSDDFQQHMAAGGDLELQRAIQGLHEGIGQITGLPSNPKNVYFSGYPDNAENSPSSLEGPIQPAKEKNVSKRITFGYAANSQTSPEAPEELKMAQNDKYVSEINTYNLGNSGRKRMTPGGLVDTSKLYDSQDESQKSLINRINKKLVKEEDFYKVLFNSQLEGYKHSREDLRTTPQHLQGQRIKSSENSANETDSATSNTSNENNNISGGVAFKTDHSGPQGSWRGLGRAVRPAGVTRSNDLDFMDPSTIGLKNDCNYILENQEMMIEDLYRQRMAGGTTTENVTTTEGGGYTYRRTIKEENTEDCFGESWDIQLKDQGEEGREGGVVGERGTMIQPKIENQSDAERVRNFGNLDAFEENDNNEGDNGPQKMPQNASNFQEKRPEVKMNPDPQNRRINKIMPDPLQGLNIHLPNIPPLLDNRSPQSLSTINSDLLQKIPNFNKPATRVSAELSVNTAYPLANEVNSSLEQPSLTPNMQLGGRGSLLDFDKKKKSLDQYDKASRRLGGFKKKKGRKVAQITHSEVGKAGRASHNHYHKKIEKNLKEKNLKEKYEFFGRKLKEMSVSQGSDDSGLQAVLETEKVKIEKNEILAKTGGNPSLELGTELSVEPPTSSVLDLETPPSKNRIVNTDQLVDLEHKESHKKRRNHSKNIFIKSKESPEDYNTFKNSPNPPTKIKPQNQKLMLKSRFNAEMLLRCTDEIIPEVQESGGNFSSNFQETAKADEDSVQKISWRGLEDDRGSSKKFDMQSVVSDPPQKVVLQLEPPNPVFRSRVKDREIFARSAAEERLVEGNLVDVFTFKKKKRGHFGGDSFMDNSAEKGRSRSRSPEMPTLDLNLINTASKPADLTLNGPRRGWAAGLKIAKKSSNSKERRQQRSISNELRGSESKKRGSISARDSKDEINKIGEKLVIKDNGGKELMIEKSQEASETGLNGLKGLNGDDEVMRIEDPMESVKDTYAMDSQRSHLQMHTLQAPELPQSARIRRRSFNRGNHLLRSAESNKRLSAGVSIRDSKGQLLNPNNKYRNLREEQKIQKIRNSPEKQNQPKNSDSGLLRPRTIKEQAIRISDSPKRLNFESVLGEEDNKTEYVEKSHRGEECSIGDKSSKINSFMDYRAPGTGFGDVCSGKTSIRRKSSLRRNTEGRGEDRAGKERREARDGQDGSLEGPAGSKEPDFLAKAVKKAFTKIGKNKNFKPDIGLIVDIQGQNKASEADADPSGAKFDPKIAKFGKKKKTRILDFEDFEVSHGDVHGSRRPKNTVNSSQNKPSESRTNSEGKKGKNFKLTELQNQMVSVTQNDEDTTQKDPMESEKKLLASDPHLQTSKTNFLVPGKEPKKRAIRASYQHKIRTFEHNNLGKGASVDRPAPRRRICSSYNQNPRNRIGANSGQQVVDLGLGGLLGAQSKALLRSSYKDRLAGTSFEHSGSGANLRQNGVLRVGGAQQGVLKPSNGVSSSHQTLPYRQNLGLNTQNRISVRNTENAQNGLQAASISQRTQPRPSQQHLNHANKPLNKFYKESENLKNPVNTDFKRQQPISSSPGGHNLTSYTGSMDARDPHTTQKLSKTRNRIFDSRKKEGTSASGGGLNSSLSGLLQWNSSNKKRRGGSEAPGNAKSARLMNTDGRPSSSLFEASNRGTGQESTSGNALIFSHRSLHSQMDQKNRDSEIASLRKIDPVFSQTQPQFLKLGSKKAINPLNTSIKSQLSNTQNSTPKPHFAHNQLYQQPKQHKTATKYQKNSQESLKQLQAHNKSKSISRAGNGLKRPHRGDSSLTQLMNRAAYRSSAYQKIGSSLQQKFKKAQNEASSLENSVGGSSQGYGNISQSGSVHHIRHLSVTGSSTGRKPNQIETPTGATLGGSGGFGASSQPTQYLETSSFRRMKSNSLFSQSFAGFGVGRPQHAQRNKSLSGGVAATQPGQINAEMTPMRLLSGRSTQNPIKEGLGDRRAPGAGFGGRNTNISPNESYRGSKMSLTHGSGFNTLRNGFGEKLAKNASKGIFGRDTGMKAVNGGAGYQVRDNNIENKPNYGLEGSLTKEAIWERLRGEKSKIFQKNDMKMIQVHEEIEQQVHNHLKTQRGKGVFSAQEAKSVIDAALAKLDKADGRQILKQGLSNNPRFRLQKSKGRDLQGGLGMSAEEKNRLRGKYLKLFGVSKGAGAPINVNPWQNEVGRQKSRVAGQMIKIDKKISLLRNNL